MHHGRFYMLEKILHTGKILHTKEIFYALKGRFFMPGQILYTRVRKLLHTREDFKH